MAGNVLDETELKQEGDARIAANLPSAFLESGQVGERFAIAPRVGLLSKGSFEVDPVKLTQGLLKTAQSNGACVCFPFDVHRLEPADGDVRIHCETGEQIFAKQVVIASGYEAARLFLPSHFSLSSSYAIASIPGHAPVWRENALIWEAAKPYLYARATEDGRIIVGGEDEDFVDADKRDALMPAKRAALETKAAKLMKRDDLEFDCAWAASFGGSPDGLPAIGPASNMANVLLAYGFGGNGVTFASLGAGIIANLVRGEADESAAWFDAYRPLSDE